MSKRMFGVAVLVLACGVALADQTWDGDTDTDFENGANWVSGSAPGAAEVAIFSGTNTYQPILTQSRSIAGLRFDSGSRTIFDDPADPVTPYTLTLGSSGVDNNGSALSVLGPDAIVSISDANTPVHTHDNNLSIQSKITGTGGLFLDGTLNNNNQNGIYLDGDNDFTGDVTYVNHPPSTEWLAAYVHVRYNNALGAKADLVVRVPDQHGYQSSGACRLYLEFPATDFASNVKEIIIEGEDTYAASFYQGEGTTISNTKISLEGGTYRFSSAGSGARTNSAEIALKAGTTSTIYRGGYPYGTWYQTGTITGDGALKTTGNNSADCEVYFRGNNTYTGGTIVDKRSNQDTIRVGHNNAFGTGPVVLATDSDTKEVFRIESNLEMANAFSGRGKIVTQSFVLTTTGSIGPGASIGQMGVEDLKFGSDSDGCDYNWDYGYVNTAAAADPPVYERKNDLIETETLEFGTAGAVLNLGTWIDESGGLYPDPEPDDYVLFTYTGPDPTLPAWTINNVPDGMVAEVRVDMGNSQVILALERPPIPEPGTLGLLILGLPVALRRRRKREKRRREMKVVRMVIVVLAAGLLASGAAMADQTWDGDTDTDFENGANWVSGSAPTDDTTTDKAVFSGTTTYLPLLTKNRGVAGLSFGAGTRSLFDSGTVYTLDIGTYGVQATGAAYNTLGSSAILSISGLTDIKQGGGSGYNQGYLIIESKITGTGGLNLAGTKMNNYQTPIYLRGDNDFTGGVTLQKAAYVHYGHANAFGSEPNMVVTVVGSNTGQSSYAAKLYLDDAADDFSSNIDEIVVEGEQTYKAGFYQGEGTSVTNAKITLEGGTYGFSSAGSGARYNSAEIALKTGTVSQFACSGSYGTWYQTGQITGGGSAYFMSGDGNSTTRHLQGDNTYTGGTRVRAWQWGADNRVRVYSNTAFGTGPVWVQANRSAIRLEADVEMANAFRGVGSITSASAYRLTTTGSIAPGDTGYDAAGTSAIGTLTVQNLTFGSDADGCEYDWDYGYVDTATAPDPPVYERKNDLIATETLEFGNAGAVLNLGTWIDESGGLYPDPEPDDYVLFTYTGADPTLPSWTINNVPDGMIAEVRVDVDNSQVILALERPPIPEPAGLSLLGLALLGLRRRRS